MRYISWIITLPIAVLAVLFAISNTETVELRLWPLEGSLSTFGFLAVYVGLVVGFLLGGFVAWLSGARSRRRARRQAAQLAVLTDEVRRHRERQAAAEDEAARAAESSRLAVASRAASDVARLEGPGPAATAAAEHR